MLLSTLSVSLYTNGMRPDRQDPRKIPVVMSGTRRLPLPAVDRWPEGLKGFSTLFVC